MKVLPDTRNKCHQPRILQLLSGFGPVGVLGMIQCQGPEKEVALSLTPKRGTWGQGRVGLLCVLFSWDS